MQKADETADNLENVAYIEIISKLTPDDYVQVSINKTYNVPFEG